MRYTTMDDGSVVFARRGEPPPDLPSYTRDPDDPYVFHPKFPDCRHRLHVIERGRCGKVIGRIWRCELKCTNVSVPFCNRCEDRP